MSGSVPSWWNRFGQEWATDGYTDDPTVAQANAGWAYIGQAPPTVEQFNSTEQWSDDKDNWLYGQIGSVITKAGITPSYDDLLQLYRAIIKLTGKYPLIQDTTFYVSISGNDLNDGLTPATAWATIQHAWDWIRDNVACNNHIATIQLANGSYAQAELKGNITPAPIIRGNTTTPSNVTVNGTSGPAFMVWQGATVNIDSVQVQAVGTQGDYVNSPDGLQARTGGFIIYSNLVFGSCINGAHMESRPFGHITAGAMGKKYTIAGPATYHVFGNQGVIVNADTIVTIVNNPAITCFGYFTHNSVWQEGGAYTGTIATGCQKYQALFNSSIDTGGVGAAHIPGSVAGTVSYGGQFV